MAILKKGGRQDRFVELVCAHCGARTFSDRDVFIFYNGKKKLAAPPGWLFVGGVWLCARCKDKRWQGN